MPALYLQTTDGAKFCRSLPERTETTKTLSTISQPPTLSTVLSSVSRATAAFMGELDRGVVNAQYVDIDMPQAQPPYFSNICGKVAHSSQEIYNSGVLPFVHSRHNGFGVFKCLFSVHGNIMTNESGTCSLFRGASSSTAALQLLQHAFKPTQVLNISAHMIVASAHLDHHVFIHNDSAEKCFASEQQAPRARWQSEVVQSFTDCSSVKSIRLHSLRKEWLETLDAGFVEKILINVGNKGSVNLFFSLHRNTSLSDGIEFRLRDISNCILGLLQTHT